MLIILIICWHRALTSFLNPFLNLQTYFVNEAPLLSGDSHYRGLGVFDSTSGDGHNDIKMALASSQKVFK